MDSNTRRLDSAGESAENDARTRRLRNENSSSERRCLRCDVVMAETMLWSQSIGVNNLFLTAPLHPRWMAFATRVSCRSMTCPECGYTELFASNIPDLDKMLSEEFEDDKR